MPCTSAPTSDRRRKIARIACVVALGALLAGCDKCGDWWWSPMRSDIQSCRDQAPKPQ